MVSAHPVFKHGAFASKLQAPVHFFQLTLCAVILGISAARMLLPNAPRGRSGTMALGMSAKSMAIISYQVITAHVKRFKKWQSLKANFVLNAMEVVFWAAVVYMTIQSQTQVCIGISCTLGWLIMALGILMSMMAGYMCIISWVDWRYWKHNGVKRSPTILKTTDAEQGAPSTSDSQQEMGFVSKPSESHQAREYPVEEVEQPPRYPQSQRSESQHSSQSAHKASRHHQQSRHHQHHHQQQRQQQQQQGGYEHNGQYYHNHQQAQYQQGYQQSSRQHATGY